MQQRPLKPSKHTNAFHLKKPFGETRIDTTVAIPKSNASGAQTVAETTRRISTERSLSRWQRLGGFVERIVEGFTDYSSTRNMWRNVGTALVLGALADGSAAAVYGVYEAAHQSHGAVAVQPSTHANWLQLPNSLESPSAAPTESPSVKPQPTVTVTAPPKIITKTIIIQKTVTAPPTHGTTNNGPAAIPTHTPTLSPSPEQSMPPPTTAPQPGAGGPSAGPSS